MDLNIIILAAGNSRRMVSKTSKIFHPLGGRPVVEYPLELARSLNPSRTIMVLSPSGGEYPWPADVSLALQPEAKGTGHAVQCALPFVDTPGAVLVLFGDTPLIERSTLATMIDTLREGSDLVVLGMHVEGDRQYGRLRMEGQRLVEIVEYKDASEEIRALTFCNSGVLLCKSSLLRELIPLLTPSPTTGEYYLIDLVKLANKRGHACTAIEGPHQEFLGINSRQDLAIAEAYLQDKWRQSAMSMGVTLLDPKSVYFSYDTQLSQDVTIHPHVVFGEKVSLEEDVTILPFCRLEGAILKKGATVGPFAHLRPGTELGAQAQIGNFVETKNVTFAAKAKAKHLSYIGDASVGAGSNVGAGTITCNYDGFKKARTEIGDGVFVGSNTSLVAPLKIGNGAMIAAGSVVKMDVPEHDLAIGRGEQKNVKEGAKRYIERRVNGDRRRSSGRE